MDKSRYTLFHDRCGDIERRFGRQGHLTLRPLDCTVIRCAKLLDFGAGKGLNAHWCDEYYTLDADATLNPNFTSVDAAVASGIQFDAIIANQVFEHIEKDDIDGVVRGLVSTLVPGGILLATIPNTHRGTYYFNDIDHKTPLMYYHLASFFELNGLRVIDAYRYAKRDVLSNATPALKELVSILEELYELDIANFLAVVGRKE